MKPHILKSWTLNWNLYTYKIGNAFFIKHFFTFYPFFKPFFGEKTIFLNNFGKKVICRRKNIKNHRNLENMYFLLQPFVNINKNLISFFKMTFLLFNIKIILKRSKNALKMPWFFTFSENKCSKLIFPFVS